MGGMKENGEWKTYDSIPFDMLVKQWQTVELKLIRRSLTEEEKKRVQALLQKAYAENGIGFYVKAAGGGSSAVTVYWTLHSPSGDSHACKRIALHQRTVCDLQTVFLGD